MWGHAGISLQAGTAPAAPQLLEMLPPAGFETGMQHLKDFCKAVLISREIPPSWLGYFISCNPKLLLTPAKVR